MYVSATIFVDAKDAAYAVWCPARPIASGSTVIAVPERVHVHVEGIALALPTDRARALAFDMLRACDESVAAAAAVKAGATVAATAAPDLVAPGDHGADLGGHQ